MEINYCFPKKRRCALNKEAKYEIINNEIYYKKGISKIYLVIEKHKKCNDCKYYLFCYLIKFGSPNKKETLFCTNDKCKKGFYKGNKNENK